MEEELELGGSRNNIEGVGDDDENGILGSKQVAKVADLMASYLKAGQLFNNAPLFTQLCFSFAKGIDNAIANHEVPIRSRDLPALLRQVFGSPEDESLLEGIMILTTSIQCVCKLGWFPDQDTRDLLNITKEVMKTFSDPEHFQIEPTYALSSVSEVISRYYPSMKIDHMLFSLELQPGYRFRVSTFPLMWGTVSPGHNKICLFVIRVDELKTAASCTITPPGAILLLNGQDAKGSSTTTALSMGEAPQLPTDVTAIVKCGVNCLQAIGDFGGKFLIAIAAVTNNINEPYYHCDTLESEQQEDHVRAPSSVLQPTDPQLSAAGRGGAAHDR